MEKILNELEKLLSTRIAVYTDGVQIKDKDAEKDVHEIILKDCWCIEYDNIKIKEYDKIILKDRRLQFIVYDEHNCINTCMLEIDLSKGYIEIYEGFEHSYVFEYKEFKPDQTIDKDRIIDLDKYPLLSYEIIESKIRPDYYEITITVRMSPLDESDYKIRAFFPMNLEFTGTLGVIEYYRDRIVKGEFAEFFRHKKFKFVEPNILESNEDEYEIIDHHFDEYYFCAVNIKNKKSNEKINIPYFDIFDKIEFID